MKNLFVIVIVTIIGFSGCKKEEQEFCWECAPYAQSYIDGNLVTIKGNSWVTCNKTESWINDREKESESFEDGILSWTKCYKI